MKDVALIPPRTVSFVTSRADANRDGTVDAADLTYIVSKLGAISPIAESSMFAGCLNADGNPINQCLCRGVPNLDNLLLNPGAPCPGPEADHPNGGGPPPNATPNWANYHNCLQTGNQAAADKRRHAFKWAQIQNGICFAVGLGAGVGGFYLFKKPLRTGIAAQAVCLAKLFSDLNKRLDEIFAKNVDDRASCKIANHIP